MIQAGVREGKCPLNQVPADHKDAIWLEPIVCTIEYMPSDKEGYRQAVFKGFRDDKLPEECSNYLKIKIHRFSSLKKN